MTPVRDRLFGFQQAFDHPVTLWVTVAVAVTVCLGGVGIELLHRRRLMGLEVYRDARQRWKSWVWLSACIVIPVLAGAAWTMLAVTILSLGCYREFARATGLFREKMISLSVVLGILTLSFATFDHYDRLFFATAPLTVVLISIVTIPMDRPHGYVQRVALAVLGFLMFGFSLGYVGYFANSPNYRPVLLLLVLGVAVNDIAAYCVGRAMGRRKLLPKTSPGKTVAGSVGALVITSSAVALIGHYVFRDTALDRVHLLLTLGLLISLLGQLGDLVLSSIKRDVGIKDIGAVIPGHGGLLDRFDSLVLPAPAVFHFVSLCLGPWSADQPARILTGG